MWPIITLLSWIVDVLCLMPTTQEQHIIITKQRASSSSSIDDLPDMWWFCKRTSCLIYFAIFFFYCECLSIVCCSCCWCRCCCCFCCCSGRWIHGIYLPFIYWVLCAFQSHQNESNWQWLLWQKQKAQKERRCNILVHGFLYELRCIWDVYTQYRCWVRLSLVLPVWCIHPIPMCLCSSIQYIDRFMYMCNQM